MDSCGPVDLAITGRVNEERVGERVVQCIADTFNQKTSGSICVSQSHLLFLHHTELLQILLAGNFEFPKD